MTRPQSAVLLMEETLLPDTHKPLMLENFLSVPILSRMCRQLLNEGVRRFFVACDPQFAARARACLPAEAEAVLSDRREDLLAFLNTPDGVLVLSRSAVPMAGAGPGFAYAAPGYELQEAWKERLTQSVPGAELTGGWLPLYGVETIAELEAVFRSRDGELNP